MAYLFRRFREATVTPCARTHFARVSLSLNAVSAGDSTQYRCLKDTLCPRNIAWDCQGGRPYECSVELSAESLIPIYVSPCSSFDHCCWQFIACSRSAKVAVSRGLFTRSSPPFYFSRWRFRSGPRRSDRSPASPPPPLRPFPKIPSKHPLTSNTVFSFRYRPCY